MWPPSPGRRRLPEISAPGANRKWQMAEEVRVFEWREGGPERRGDGRSVVMTSRGHLQPEVQT